MKLLKTRPPITPATVQANVDRALTIDEIILLRDRIGSRKDLGPRGNDEADELHRRAHSANRWFECYCGGPEQPQALLIPVRGQRGAHFQKYPGWPTAHAEGCPFERDAPNYQAYRRSLRRPASDERFTFLTQPAGRSGQAQTPSQDDDERRATRAVTAGGARRRPKLSRLLFTLVERAELDLHQPDQHGKKWQSRIRAAAEDIEIAKTRKLSIFLALSVDDIPGILRKLRSTREHWPAGVMPQGIAIFPIESFAGTKITMKDGKSFEIGCEVRAFGESGAKSIRGPYVFIGVFAKASEAPISVAFDMAYAHPLSQFPTWCPVDSDLERMTLLRLRDLQARTASTELRFDIKKQLFDMSTDDRDEVFKPDFILYLSKDIDKLYPVVVETMGYDSPDYRASKAITHPRMAKLGAVIEHQCYLRRSGTPFPQIDAKLVGDAKEALQSQLAKLRSRNSRRVVSPPSVTAVSVRHEPRWPVIEADEPVIMSEGIGLGVPQNSSDAGERRGELRNRGSGGFGFLLILFGFICVYLGWMDAVPVLSGIGLFTIVVGGVGVSRFLRNGRR